MNGCNKGKPNHIGCREIHIFPSKWTISGTEIYKEGVLYGELQSNDGHTLFVKRISRNPHINGQIAQIKLPDPHREKPSLSFNQIVLAVILLCVTLSVVLLVIAIIEPAAVGRVVGNVVRAFHSVPK